MQKQHFRKFVKFEIVYNTAALCEEHKIYLFSHKKKKKVIH